MLTKKVFVIADKIQRVISKIYIIAKYILIKRAQELTNSIYKYGSEFNVHNAYITGNE